MFPLCATAGAQLPELWYIILSVLRQSFCCRCFSLFVRFRRFTRVISAPCCGSDWSTTRGGAEINSRPARGFSISGEKNDGDPRFVVWKDGKCHTSETCCWLGHDCWSVTTTGPGRAGRRPLVPGHGVADRPSKYSSAAAWFTPTCNHPIDVCSVWVVVTSLD